MFNSSRSVFRYLALSLALGAACLSAPALAKDNDDLLGDFVDRFIHSDGHSGKPYEPNYDKSKYKSYKAEDLYNHARTVKNELEAYGFMRAAGEKGHVEAMLWMGDYYDKNKDNREAFFWYKKAADANSERGAFITGNMYFEGKGTKKDEKKGADYLKRAAAKGNGEAAIKLSELNLADAETEFKLGNFYARQNDYKESLSHLTRSAEMGNADAQCILGSIYIDFHPESKKYNVPKDEKKAFELFEKAAEQNQPNAQFGLGVIYYNGLYVTQDDGKAFEFFERAAEQNFPAAQYMLALMYRNGKGTVKDEAKALDLMEKAANSGDQLAQYDLGKTKIESDDFREGFRWMKKCAETDVKSDLGKLAAAALSYMYFNGQGTEKDNEEALKWAEQSQDLATSKMLLAYMYYFGLGVEKDFEKSAELAEEGKDILNDTLKEESQGDSKKLQEASFVLHSSKLHLMDIAQTLGDTAQKDLKLAEGFLPISAGIYQNTAQYDSLVPYNAFTLGKAALEKDNPKGYALLESSARRGCSQAKILFASYFLPPNHPLKIENTSAFDLEGKNLDDKERMQRYLKWMNSAAENGSSTAAKTLAELYREGKYVGKDANQIFKYTKIAALAKEPEYMYRLGTYYAQGLGCQKDRAAAVKWVKQAAHLGSSEASEWIEDRRGHYVDAEVAAGSERVNIYTVFDNVDKRFYERYNRMKDLGYPDRVAATEALIYSGRVTVGTANFCISRGAAIPASVCGIVGNTFTDKGINYAVLAYDGETLLLRDFAKLYLYKGKAVCVSCGLKNPIANSVVDSYDSARTIYKTVREWHGPKVKGWEDLL